MRRLGRKIEIQGERERNEEREGKRDDENGDVQDTTKKAGNPVD